MGLLSNLGLKPSQASQADKAKADALKAQFGKSFKDVVVQATRMHDQKAKADIAKDLKAADADLRKANAIRNPTQRAQAMQAALDKLNASAKKAKESQDAEKAPAPKQETEQAAQAKPKAADKPDTQSTGPGPIEQSGIGTSTAKIIRERIARAKALQAEAAAAKSTAVARGNQLYKLFHANESNTGAGQAHNRGMAKLKSGDANAAKIKPELDFEASGAAAIQDYNAASEAFGEGLAMCGQPSKPLAKKEPVPTKEPQPAKEKPAPDGKPEVTKPETAGKPEETPVAKNKDGKDQTDDKNNRTTTTIKTKMKDGAQITEIDKNSVSNKDGVLSESHTKEKQTIGPKGIELESKRQSQTVDKDGVTLENEDSSMVIDGKGKRATNKKAKLKVGNKSTTSSQETEVQATDGSRDIVASEVESGSTDDGGSVLVKKHSTTHVDPAGNSATVKATHKSVTGKDGKVSQSTSVTVEKKSAEEAAAEKKKVAEEKKKAEEAKQQREASAKALKAQAAAAKANAVGRGNRLYQLFHADESRKGAGQAHNRGMAKLASGDANAAKIKPEAEGFEAAGQAAIDDYQAAGQAFDEGIAMCGGAVKPAQVVPASGGM